MHIALVKKYFILTEHSVLALFFQKLHGGMGRGYKHLCLKGIWENVLPQRIVLKAHFHPMPLKNLVEQHDIYIWVKSHSVRIHLRRQWSTDINCRGHHFSLMSCCEPFRLPAIAIVSAGPRKGSMQLLLFFRSDLRYKYEAHVPEKLGHITHALHILKASNKATSTQTNAVQNKAHLGAAVLATKCVQGPPLLCFSFKRPKCCTQSLKLGSIVPFAFWRACLSNCKLLCPARIIPPCSNCNSQAPVPLCGPTLRMPHRSISRMPGHSRSPPQLRADRNLGNPAPVRFRRRVVAWLAGRPLAGQAWNGRAHHASLLSAQVCPRRFPLFECSKHHWTPCRKFLFGICTRFFSISKNA